MPEPRSATEPTSSRLVLHLLALVCVLVVGLPVLTGHWVGGHEGYSYLWRAAEMQAQLAQGTLWPRWCPDFYWGFGYPFFVFYPPGAFLMGSVLGAATPGLWWGLGLASMVGSAALFYGMRRLALLFVAERPARVASVLASVAMYRFVQLWVRGDYAESIATGIVPWVLAEAVILMRGADRSAAARLAMGVALVSFTHTLTAVMICAALAVAGIATGARSRSPSPVFAVGLPSVLGLVLSAGYWLPVAVQAPLVRFSDMVNPVPGSTSYHWADHFPTLMQRVIPSFGFGGSVPGPDDGMSMATSLVGWAVVVAGLALMRGKGARSRLLPIMVAWFAVQALMSPVSTLLWQWVPGLRMFQFPWRFLLLNGVLVALIGAIVVDELGPRLRADLVVGGLALLLAGPVAVTCLQHAQAEPFPLGPTAVAALEDPRQLQTLGAFSEGSKHTPLTTAGRNEYLPRSVTQPPRQHPASLGASSGPRNLGPPREQVGAEKTWMVRVPETARYEVSWFAFPGLSASVDGARVDVLTSPQGLVALDLAAGDHVVRVAYKGTWDQRLGAGLGALGWILALLVLLRARRLNRSAES